MGLLVLLVHAFQKTTKIHFFSLHVAVAAAAAARIATAAAVSVQDPDHDSLRFFFCCLLMLPLLRPSACCWLQLLDPTATRTVVRLRTVSTVLCTAARLPRTWHCHLLNCTSIPFDARDTPPNVLSRHRAAPRPHPPRRPPTQPGRVPRAAGPPARGAGGAWP